MEICEYTKQTGGFLKAQDVKDSPESVWEITGEGEMAENQKFGGHRLHLPIKCGETPKIFDCSKTNARFIELALNTSDTSQWIGKLLTFDIYKTKTPDNKLVDVVNVKLVK